MPPMPTAPPSVPTPAPRPLPPAATRARRFKPAVLGSTPTTFNDEPVPWRELALPEQASDNAREQVTVHIAASAAVHVSTVDEDTHIIDGVRVPWELAGAPAVERDDTVPEGLRVALPVLLEPEAPAEPV